jgi:hypothetical protein
MSLAPIDMRAMLDAPDINHTIVLDRAKRYTVIAAAPDTWSHRTSRRTVT